MFLRHVSRDLSAYRDGQLPPARAQRVEEHLARCGDCRRALDDISFGMRLAARLPLAETPDSVWPAIRDRLERPSAHRSPARLLVPAAALSGAVVAVLLALVWYVALRNPLHVTENDRPPSRLETIAIEEHLRRLTGESGWQIRTSEIPRLRQWVRDSTPMTADEIPVERAPGDDRRLHIVGARLARIGAATAAVIGYEVDSEPVTLATARLDDLPDPPDAAVFSKDVRYRFDPAHGYKVVTWGVAHKGYAMVSRLPGYGQGGCLLCHTAPERRQIIESATVRRN